MLTYKSIVDVVRKSVPADQSASYACHSFRRGGATYMFSIGMSTEMIRLMGDWKSECFRKYIFVDTAAITRKAVVCMQRNMPKEL